jgi:flagellar motility protein MotE (MotC chaperone)
MMRFLRDVRLIPIVLVATVCLFALKISGLVFDGGYTLAEHIDRNFAARKVAIAEAAQSAPDFPKVAAADGLASRPAFNFADASDDITGSVDKDKSEAKDKSENKSENKDKKDEKGAEQPKLTTSEKPPGPPKVEVGNVSVSIEPGRIASAGERAVLERLRERNQELDARKRELDMRENLIKAAEKRLEAKVTELKDTEARVNTAFGNRDKAEAARFGSIVSMYENMKPKDAARIFDRLELNILVDVSTKINPRKMSDILAQMSPDMAERLTVELASRAGTAPKRQDANQLPKIEGKPGG